MNRITILSALMTLALVVGGLGAQDQIVLKNGSVFSGRIVKSEPAWVTIVTDNGTFRFRRAEVARLDRAIKPVRGAGGGPKPAPKRNNPGAVVKVVSDVFGRLDELRLDRHPAYDSLGNSGIGAWALFSTPGGRPHYSEERWIVEAVSGTRVTVLKEMLDYGAVVGWKRETIDRRDFGPEMPAAILKSCTLGKQEVRTALGRFATMCVKTEVGDRETWIRHYCPAVSILGLVEEYRGGEIVRRLLRFGWKGRRPQALGGKAAAAPAEAAAQGANPVEAAFRRARPGDFAVWCDPTTGRRWREVVFRVTPADVTVQTQAWIAGEFHSQGARRYDLGRADRDYLERAGAVLVGSEVLGLAGRRLTCSRWRSPSGHVEFWTCADVTVGGLVRQSIRGKVVCDLVTAGRDLALLESK